MVRHKPERKKLNGGIRAILKLFEHQKVENAPYGCIESLPSLFGVLLFLYRVSEEYACTSQGHKKSLALPLCGIVS